MQIVDGRLWVTHFPWTRWPDGVVPLGLTPWDSTNGCKRIVDPANPNFDLKASPKTDACVS